MLFVNLDCEKPLHAYQLPTQASFIGINLGPSGLTPPKGYPVRACAPSVRPQRRHFGQHPVKRFFSCNCAAFFLFWILKDASIPLKTRPCRSHRGRKPCLCKMQAKQVLSYVIIYMVRPKHVFCVLFSGEKTLQTAPKVSSNCILLGEYDLACISIGIIHGSQHSKNAYQYAHQTNYEAKCILK